MFKFVSLLILSFLSGAAPAETVLVLGDSLSAAYGLSSIDRGWVALLQERLAMAGMRVANASISGETSAGGLARVDALLRKTRPAVVILELGANDGLRGLAPNQTKANLSGIVSRAQSAGAKVLLLGMRLPPNYGKRYTEMFEQIFRQVAEEHRIVYVPFFLEGVGGNGQLTQGDGLHPNEAAQPVMLEHVWQALQPLLAAEQER